MRNQQLFEAPFVSEVGTNYCSKCISSGAGKCICKRCQSEASPPFKRTYSKRSYETQWLFEVSPILTSLPEHDSALHLEWEIQPVVLRSDRFRANARLQAAANNRPPMRIGERGASVKILQQALMDLGFPMSISTRQQGRPDGIYGSETMSTVRKFQIMHRLKADGIAGRQTLLKLDQMFAKSEPQPPIPTIPPDDRTAIVYENKVTENKSAFVAKVRAISAALSIKPDWLMAVMHRESGLDHRIQNQKSKATGLIQFMPSTAKALGTTVDALRAMSNVEQLDYVYKYFAPQKGRIRSYSDLYLVTFYPYALRQSDDFVLGSEVSPARAKKVRDQNQGIDLNKDGVITKGEFRQWIYRGIPSNIRQRLE